MSAIRGAETTVPPVAVFRADASVDIGSGHVMRCLALAGHLRTRGWTCRFITRALPGMMAARIEAGGFATYLLPAPDGVPQAATGPDHAHWLGVPWERDAAETLSALGSTRPDLLVVDHYGIDARWERRLRGAARHVLVIDDLADRMHDCDLLLDQTLGRPASAYADLVPKGCHLMAGARYALLRPEFRASRDASLAGRRGRGLHRLLVAMGGHDRDNTTAQVLDCIAADMPPGLTHVDVVLGGQAPWIDAVRKKAGRMPVRTIVLTDVDDMAPVMARADVAIGGAGTSTWERCCMGLPSLVLVMAANQMAIAAALDEQAVAAVIGRVAAPGWQSALMAALHRLADVRALDAAAVRASAVIDGLGLRRVGNAISAADLVLRPARMEDAKAIWEWRRASDPRHFRSGSMPPLAAHLQWFEQALAAPERLQIVAERGGGAVALVRLDRTEAQGRSALVSVLIAPAARGRGLAGPVLHYALILGEMAGVAVFTASVHEDNAASLRLFEGAGFAVTGRDGAFISFRRDRSGDQKGAQQ